MKYKNITADAGYESEENYIFPEENNQTAFIKPANYEISKTRKYKNDIGKIENMKYDSGNDFYSCRNNKKLMVDYLKHSKSTIILGETIKYGQKRYCALTIINR